MRNIYALLLASFCVISLQTSAQPPPPVPVIDSFSPREVHGGEVLLIHGDNFPTTTNDLDVLFCELFFADPVPVLASSPTTIAVRVPTNSSELFGTETSVCLRVGNQIADSGATRVYLLPPPEITSVSPNVVLPGGLLEVRGRNFRGEAGFYRAFI